MKKTLEQAALLAVLLVLAGCAGNEPAEPKWEEHLYRTVVYNSGEDESDAKYLEIAQRSQKLLSLLEEKTGAFGHALDDRDARELETWRQEYRREQ